MAVLSVGVGQLAVAYEFFDDAYEIFFWLHQRNVVIQKAEIWSGSKELLKALYGKFCSAQLSES